MKKVLFVTQKRSRYAEVLNLPFGEEEQALLSRAFIRAGFAPEELEFTYAQDLSFVPKHEANLVVPVGSEALFALTGEASCDKWQCSVIPARAEYGGKKCMPLLHPERVLKTYSDTFYYFLGAERAFSEASFPDIRLPKVNFVLSPTFAQALELLAEAQQADIVALDIETSAGLINTFGFAFNGTAVAIRTTEDCYSPEEYFALWKAIAALCEATVPKTCQNACYEVMFLSAYGIRIENLVWDTMHAMKFLYPELDKGLDNVGRIYTPFPYWKDDNDDWNSIGDWKKHLTYNCKDTIGTLYAYHAQRKDMEARGLIGTFEKLVASNWPIIWNMVCTGLHVDEENLAFQRNEAALSSTHHNEVIEKFFNEKLKRPVNTRSPVQLKNALKECGFKLPVSKKHSAKGTEYKESTDKKALTKLRKKYPDVALFNSLIELSGEQKLLSSYLGFNYDHATKQVRYMLDGHATETGRWGSYSDPWGNGFNAQTVPKEVRRCFRARPGMSLMQIDLSQAESRYVALDSPEPKLMELLDKGQDVHKYVASKIFGKPEELITKAQRQLGKKSGHSANYGVGPKTFADACLVEMNMVISEREAARIIDGYYGVFPGIRRRQHRIEQQIRRHRKLVTPLGRERMFFDRINDKTFREGYAYEPQSTIPDITNALMRFLFATFDEVNLLLQVHDSLLFECPQGYEGDIANAARDYSAWHPEIILPGGKLIIPVDCEFGTHWEPMQKC